jgi:hypothetical protein
MYWAFLFFGSCFPGFGPWAFPAQAGPFRLCCEAVSEAMSEVNAFPPLLSEAMSEVNAFPPLLSEAMSEVNAFPPLLSEAMSEVNAFPPLLSEAMSEVNAFPPFLRSRSKKKAELFCRILFFDAGER